MFLKSHSRTVPTGCSLWCKPTRRAGAERKLEEIRPRIQVKGNSEECFAKWEGFLLIPKNFKEALQVQTDFSSSTFFMPRNWDIKMPGTPSISEPCDKRWRNSPTTKITPAELPKNQMLPSEGYQFGSE